MASSAVSIDSSRASWLIHAEISATAGRRFRSRSSADGGVGGAAPPCPPAPRPGSRRRSIRGVSIVDAARLGEFLQRSTGTLRDARGWRDPAAPGGPARRDASPAVRAMPPRPGRRPRALGRRVRASFSRSHASSGFGTAHRLACAVPRRHRPPTRSVRPRQLGREPVVDFEEVLHVGGGVLHLVVGQRATQPVGQSITLGRRHTDLALQQRHQRRRAVAGEPGGDLGVEHPRRHGPDGVGQHIEILLGGVDHAERLGPNSGANDRTSTASGSMRATCWPAPASSQATWISASLGKYVRSRWNSVSSAYRRLASSASISVELRLAVDPR